ncbi:unnamed protein product [Linum trigynum]|uniref:Uncharacterized protein n=1 Tax=Linum trigynum TaxID=586398 RepID=A0AAV2D5F0_9ROSI
MSGNPRGSPREGRKRGVSAFSGSWEGRNERGAWGSLATEAGHFNFRRRRERRVKAGGRGAEEEEKEGDEMR